MLTGRNIILQERLYAAWQPVRKAGRKRSVRQWKKTVFVGTFTAKGPKEHIENGKPALFVTERAVLEAREDGVYLLEVAPGIDIQKGVIDRMAFEPKIPEGGVKTMPPEIFEEDWFGLSAILDAKE